MQPVAGIKGHLIPFLYQSYKRQRHTFTFLGDYFELFSQIPFLPYAAELTAVITKTDKLTEFIPASLAHT